MGESGFRSAAVFLCVAADVWSAFSPRPAFPPRAGLSRSPGPPPQSSPPRSHTRPGGRSVVSVEIEEHTSELQSRGHLVCRLLLEKKKQNKTSTSTTQAV